MITEDELMIEEHHVRKALNAVVGVIRHLESAPEPARPVKNGDPKNQEPNST